MKRHPIKIGIAGTHSTGKSTFMAVLASHLEGRGLKIGRINDLAKRARDLGFPILTEHTCESTLWIMAECMRQETEASLTCDVILVDRPVLDALGYLQAALEVTGRSVRQERLDELKAVARAHTTNYDLLINTSLDHSVPLGEGRDQDPKFRDAVATHIDELMRELAPGALRMTSKNRSEIVTAASEFVLSCLAAE